MIRYRSGWKLVALLLAMLAASEGHAQPGVCTAPAGCESGQGSNQALVLAANTLIGGASSGIASAVRGESFWHGFRAGAVGGAVVFAGKRLAVEHFDGAGFAGRQLASVGSSITHNASVGNDLFGELMFPLGPTRLHLRTRARPVVHLRLDLYSSAVLMHALLDRRAELDVRRSLSSGAFVFWDSRDRADERWLARERAGLVRLNRDEWWRHADRHLEIEAHERVHVLQYDQSHLLVGAALQRLAVDLLPALDRGTRWIDLGLEALVWAAANSVIPYDQRPWEREAAALTRIEGAERPPRSAVPDLPIGPGGGTH